MFLEMQLLLFAKETVRANGFYQSSPYSVIDIIFPIVRNTCGESMSLRSFYSLIAYFIHFKWGFFYLFKHYVLYILCLTPLMKVKL